MKWQIRREAYFWSKGRETIRESNAIFIIDDASGKELQ